MNVIFPISGLGSRFGYKFKPLIRVTDKTCIELAKEPFNYFWPHVTYYFIYRQSHENEAQKLYELFPLDKIKLICVPDTNGPLQTIQEAIKQCPDIKGPSFVCDCDHRIDISPMIDHLHEDVIVPCWTINETNQHLFGKVRDINGNLEFCEKDPLESSKGLIGCYFFKEIRQLLDCPPKENISDALPHINGIKLVDIKNADFFGTPELLQEFRFKRAQKFTFFIDIDGTLVNQETREILPGTLDKLHELKSIGHSILLVTARENAHELPAQLKEFTCVTNVSPGSRIIINDRKPYIPYYPTAESIVLDRNKGISDIKIPNIPPSVIKVFDGASFEKVYLTQSKTIIKHAKTEPDTLKRQCDDLKRLYSYNPHIFPKIIKEYSASNDEFYYEMEYLEDYRNLSSFSAEIIDKTVQKILKDLNETVYCYRKYLSGEEKVQWLKQFLSNKIWPRCSHGLTNQQLHINGTVYPSIHESLKRIDLSMYAPDFICPIHGDLTLENIMYNEKTDEYKLIDPAGSQYMDAPEMDLGKLAQSLISKYSSWKDLYGEDLVQEYFYSVEGVTVCEYKINPIYTSKTYTKDVFYMCMYFIRMIPFMKNRSREHEIFIILLCTHYLSIL